MTDAPEDPVERLRESRELGYEAFSEPVREEAAVLKEHITSGTFDNDQATLGLEYEFYGVDRESNHLRRLPRALLTAVGFEKELGLHNAELNTGIHPCNAPGLEALLKEVEGKVYAIQNRARTEDIRLVSDGMWTIGPEENTTRGYLMEATHEEGLTLAINVSNAVRYHGFASVPRSTSGRVDVPGATIDADSPGPVSLTASIQPHYQVPRAAALPRHLATAIRVAGPLLALGANSPFLPPSLYDDTDPGRPVLLEDGWAEHRIPVYEGMMNPADDEPKVRFPRDVETPVEAVDRIVADPTIVPAEIEAGERFDDAFVHLRHKHGSYWRWVRPVFGGASEASANCRIEFRPIPGQPTLRDTIAYVAAVAGLLTAFEAGDHPARGLAWTTARSNFYAAARDGLTAELTWITAQGDRTTDTREALADLLETASEGLERQGFQTAEAATWLEPLRARLEQGRGPAEWKRQHVAAGLEEGLSLTEAINRMQRDYIAHQAATFRSGTLADWPDP